MKSLELPVAQPDGTESGCCLSPQELEVRRAEWNNLSTQGLIDVARDCEDLVLRHRRDPEDEAVLRYLVAQEGACCSSVRFDISVSDDELALRISGPWQETPWAGAPVSEPTANAREFVQARYAAVAQAITELSASDQSGANGCGAAFDPNGLEQLEGLKGVSLGCGNSIGPARLKEGETVLDLGSGAGLEAFVAAKRVGGAGYVYGLDMTEEMLEIARKNQTAAGIKNVEFLKGQIERVPLPDSSVDVIISNCVSQSIVIEERRIRGDVTDPKARGQDRPVGRGRGPRTC